MNRAREWLYACWPLRRQRVPLLRAPLRSIKWERRELILQLSREHAGSLVALDLDGIFLLSAPVDAEGKLRFAIPYSPSGASRMRLLPRLGRDGAALLDTPLVVDSEGVRSDVEHNGGASLLPLIQSAQLLPYPLPQMNPQLAIVIPVYNAAHLLERCLDSVLAQVAPSVRVIVIDDASPDPQVSKVLQERRDHTQLEIHRNVRNLGFTATANRGFDLAAGADVVILNADTRVGPCWLQGLRRAAYSAADVATATAVSDNAGAFSVPELEQFNPLPSCWSFADAARATWQQAGLDYPRLPTGNGFCMYLRREVLDGVGPFDAQAFPQGYGEENDWSQRAAAQGWQHVVAGNVLVSHARSASFGDARRVALGVEGMAVMRARWPNYEYDVGHTLFSWQRRVLDWRLRRTFAAARAVSAPRPRRLWLDRPATLDPRHEHWRIKASGAHQLLLRHDGDWQRVEKDVAGLHTVSTWLQRYAIEQVCTATPLHGDTKQLLAALDIPVACA